MAELIAQAREQLRRRQYAEAAQSLQLCISQAEDPAIRSRAVFQLGSLYCKMGQHDAGGVLYVTAAQVATKASIRNPALENARLCFLKSTRIPIHVFMSALNDQPRTSAYSAALTQGSSQKRALCIGPMGWLYGMLAAKNGTATATACVQSQMVQKLASDCVAANQLSDRVTIFDGDALTSMITCISQVYARATRIC